MLGAMVIGTQAANADTQIGSGHVRVEQGDTISEIAKKHNISTDSLVQANHLSNPDMIFVGDTLVLTPNASNNEATTQTPSDGASQHMNQPVHMIENSENNVNNNQPATTTAHQSTPVATSTTGGSSADAIAQAESGGSYVAQNGRYYGKYQLDLAYLGGDLSPQHQEEVFQQYCNQRYGSVNGALSFRQSHGWY